MGKFTSSICGTTCVAWIAVWSWWLSKESAIPSTETLIPTTTIRVVDADSVFSASNIFSFGMSEAKVEMPVESAEMLKSITRYLVEYPEKTLTLTGEYLSLPYERNQTMYPNLGIARANAIKDVLVANGADEERIHTDAMQVKGQYMVGERMLGGITFLFDSKKIAQNEVQEESPSEDNVEGASQEEETEEPKEDAPELVFKYKRKSYSLDRKNKPALDNIRRLLRKNRSYKVMLIGYSTKGEEASVRDLANRRARAVRRYLVDTGVRRKNIIVEARPGAANDGTERMVEIRIVK